MYKPKLEQFHKYQETESGVFGLFDTQEEILHAAKKTKEKNYSYFDCFTPLPVHGLDDAMGLPRSGLPWITFIFGIVGFAVGLSYQYLTHAIDWQIVYSGKAYNAWPAYVPILFEATVFFAGVATVFAMYYITGLYKFDRKPIHPDVTSHRFALWIPSNVAGYNESEVIQFIKSLGAKEVQVVKK
ncbi:MAG: DUF3341 domain-containing protein [Leptospiraceae bacterium]|nr:DUF3341 domain-containing protein [Leptospiraceae bacterium]MCK6380265.1 DUF3341 domain-containing protein [Leptospiraceae bacterium]NUM41100.1 DUF3341 domain-containing protein [Leptospiraceae bacterium]